MNEHELVVLTHDVPEHGLAVGDIGTIVHRYDDDGFEVEFSSAEGRTIAVLTMVGADIRPMKADEILHARKLAVSS